MVERPPAARRMTRAQRFGVGAAALLAPAAFVFGMAGNRRLGALAAAHPSVAPSLRTSSMLYLAIMAVSAVTFVAALVALLQARRRGAGEADGVR